MRTVVAGLVLFFCCFAFAQHEHHPGMSHEGMAHKMDHAATMQVANDTAAHVLTVKVGPLNLPAHASHMDVAQAMPQTLEVPVEGWFTAYHPRLVDAGGHVLPGRMLHHVAFWNTGRPDFLCPNKLEHIFGAGGEMNDWPALPGIGYRVHPGDRIRVDTMFHNPTGESYPQAYLEVRIEYAPAGTASLRSVYPTWFDVKECGNSGYDLAAGDSTTTGKFTLGFNGRLLGVGGHLHDYGRSVELVDKSSGQVIADLPAKLDDHGHILSMPIKTFAEQGGLPLEKGNVLEVSAKYLNPTPKTIPEGAMGIAVGYFLPEKDEEFAALKK
jgi:hypothetical protein